ncbi:MAG: Molybdopterin synthase catalytic subunit [Bacteroidetes bacterium ADurb.Bin397]|jgi:molybdopterin synthase catalytic subunit|nr:MAG: Molybdopterin synthase catalytic subunit [Bacteroidetes bacterium ADurb.Bin397]
MKEHKKKEVFIEGPVSPEKIATSIAGHSSQTGIGAHSIFLGQVRADIIDNKEVIGIEYTCYKEMADEILFSIREETFSRFQLSCMHIYHSLGLVKTGEISLFVFTSSRHRKMAIDACAFVVEEIKNKVPVWGKELLNDNTHSWKQNTSTN